MSARLSLAQQIAELDSVAPASFDPEHVENPLEERESDLIAGRDHYVDVGPSTLRKAHQSILDPKYGGVRTSRKQLVDIENEFDDDDMQPNVSDSTHSSESEDDGAPGEAIWDSLVDARIRLQKSLIAANRLPASLCIFMYRAINPESSSPELPQSLSGMLREAVSLSEEIFDMQETLLVDASCELPARKRRRVDGESRNEFETYFRDATHHESVVEKQYHPHLIQTLTKWSAKIQAVAPSVLLQSNRNTFSKNSQNLKSAVQLIDEALGDQTKLLQRTQLWRGKGPRLANSTIPDDEEERAADIFDDTDFYQQLLRDVIDAKNGVNGPDDWIVAQKQRKAKKKVDTKASKGRKIRYDVHEKLQNFMVPISVQGAWHDQQIDELFGSILGLGLENALSNDAPVDDDVRVAAQGGFRVFG
ncbi:apoptosis-antagonizing transcription factor [Mucidula mucida]|nr:apoptosis-antagonizing transcription factor [Mucidula mucida]